MNKRIKNKVTKRIINKMQSKKNLTEFEKKFFDKYLCDSFSDIATEFLNSFISVMTRWLEYEKEKVESVEVPDTTVHSVIQVGGRNIVASGSGQLISEDKLEKYFKEKGCSDEEFAGLAGNLFVEPTEEERLQSAIDAMNNFGKQMNPEPPTPVEEPTKWNKLKGKVKGWFGK